MPLRNSWNSRAIHIALVEPCGADAHWFNLTAKESKCSLVVTHYTTGLSALTQWKTVPSVIDVVVVSDLLPMLTVDEFIQEARSAQPLAMIVAARDGISFLKVAADASYVKPFTIEAIQDMVLRVSPIPANRATGGTTNRNVRSRSISPALFRTATQIAN